MSRRTVIVDIVANDKFSKSLGSIKGGLNSLVTGAVIGISSAVTDSILNGVGNVLDKLKGQFDKAIDTELNQLAGANDLLSIGVVDSFTQASDQYNNLRNILAKEAAILPGSTEDFLQVFRGSLATIAGTLQSEGKDVSKGLENYAKNITPKLSLLQQTDPTLQNKDISAFIKGFLGGKSLKQLQGEEFLSKVPTFTKHFNAAFNKGLEGLDALEFAVDKAVTQDLVNGLNKSMSSILEGFKDRLFGLGGFLDFSRDIFTNQEGVQSILEQAKNSLTSIIGDDGILASIARILNLKDTSILQFLFNKLEGFNNWLRRVDLWLDGMISIDEFKDKLITKLSNFLERNLEFDTSGNSNLSSFISDLTYKVLYNLLVIPLNAIGDNPEETGGVIWGIIWGVLKGLGQGIVRAFQSLNPGGKVALVLSAGILIAIKTISFAALGKLALGLLFDGITKAIGLISFGKIAALGGIIIGAIKTGFLAVISSGFISSIGTGLMAIIGVVLSPIGLIALAVGAAIAGITYLIVKNWDSIKPWLSNLLDTILKLLGNVSKWLSNLGSNIKQLFNIIRSWLSGKQGEIIKWGADAWDKVMSVANSAAATLTKLFTGIQAVWNASIARIPGIPSIGGAKTEIKDLSPDVYLQDAIERDQAKSIPNTKSDVALSSVQEKRDRVIEKNRQSDLENQKSAGSSIASTGSTSNSTTNSTTTTQNINLNIDRIDTTASATNVVAALEQAITERKFRSAFAA